MANTSPVKHVIFLGAGASKTSGYPLADELRLRLSSQRQYETDMHQVGAKVHDVAKAIPILQTYFSRFKATVDLFRHGAFGTVDEFSKLASNHYPEHVHKMKLLVKLALLLHNPEDAFQNSDYSPFIKQLFKDDLYSFREDITILSYNYDCYLDFLLLKAYSIRGSLVADFQSNSAIKNNLTSGFYDLQNTNSLASDENQLRHFKLHGSIGYATDDEHKQMFASHIINRVKSIEDQAWEHSVPPIIFPWEVLDENGEFLHAQDFVFCKQAKEPKRQSDAVLLYNLLSTIWQGAKRAVQKAEKISFVGMSMHSYLMQGLKFLFREKQNTVQVVVVNPLNEQFKNDRQQLHPASPCGRLSSIFKQIAPNMTYHKSFSENDDSTVDAQYAKRTGGSITARYHFKDFIDKEMT